MGVGEGEEGILSRRRLQRGRCRGWRQVTGVEGGVQDGKEEEDDEDGDADDERREEEDEEEEEENVYGAISRPWSWRVRRRRIVKVEVEEGWREEGQGESAEQYSESGRVGGINEGLKKYEKEGEEDNRKAMKKMGEMAHLVVATLPDDLFVELAGFMRLPWDEDEGEEGWRVEDRRSKEAAAFYVRVQNEGGMGYTPWTYRISHYFRLGECQGLDGKDLEWSKRM
ncbi:hypothetical protein Naga_100294g13 [Nannochloropsis gaditana]|uniref:Uncharacterized protein n=1 Tax=Nannochloropsis gaditana TaxID=72520 RepID=W7TCS9_9STRA|nr:hypothetical protein Naga_100294g13 [Nannochloropsis gaditana]